MGSLEETSELSNDLHHALDGNADDDNTAQPPLGSACQRLSLREEWRLLSRKSKFFSAKAAVVASIGGLLFGYDVGVVEGALPQLADEMSLSLGQQDMVVAVMVFGAFVGSLFAGYLTDRLGRWFTIVFTDVAFVVGGAVLFVAPNPGTVLLGRFIVGMAVSVSAVADVSYLAEVAPEAFRGGMVSCNELAISIGMLTSFTAGHALSEIHGGWRFMFGFSSLLAILQLGLMLAVMPRSPRWLMIRKRREEARSILLEIRNSQDEVEAEMRHIEMTERSAEGSLWELLTAWRLPLLVTTTLAVFQQLTGQNNVLNFTPQIFRESGLTTTSPALWLGCIKVVFTIIAITKVDEFGRRPLLLMGAAGCAASLWLLSIGFLADVPLLSFLACCALIASYSVGFGPGTWLVTAEMFPAGIRGKALGIGQMGNFAGNLVASSFFLRLLHAAGGFVTFFLFGSIVFISCVFIYAAVPETKHKEPGRIALEIPSLGAFSTCLSYQELDEIDVSEEVPRKEEERHSGGTTEKWL